MGGANGWTGPVGGASQLRQWTSQWVGPDRESEQGHLIGAVGGARWGQGEEPADWLTVGRANGQTATVGGASRLVDSGWG